MNKRLIAIAVPVLLLLAGGLFLLLRGAGSSDSRAMEIDPSQARDLVQPLIPGERQVTVVYQQLDGGRVYKLVSRACFVPLGPGKKQKMISEPLISKVVQRPDNFVVPWKVVAGPAGLNSTDPYTQQVAKRPAELALITVKSQQLLAELKEKCPGARLQPPTRPPGAVIGVSDAS